MSVAQAAKKLGISVSLIRHYEKEFELRFGRTKGGQRIITDRDLENLRIIRSYRDQNVPIEEIRLQLAPPAPDLAEAQPDLKDVIGALIARQDELERVVKLQQQAIGQLLGENQSLKLLQERVQLLLEAPKEPDPQLQALAEQVAALESSREVEASALRERLESLQSAVDAHDGGASDEFEALQARLVELEREIRSQGSPSGDQQLVAELQEKLQGIEEALAAKRHGPSDDVVRGLQRRLLDLEAAFVAREEAPAGRDDESLLDTLVTAIQDEARRRRPWWQFWV